MLTGWKIKVILTVIFNKEDNLPIRKKIYKYQQKVEREYFWDKPKLSNWKNIIYIWQNNKVIEQSS